MSTESVQLRSDIRVSQEYMIVFVAIIIWDTVSLAFRFSPSRRLGTHVACYLQDCDVAWRIPLRVETRLDQSQGCLSRQVSFFLSSGFLLVDPDCVLVCPQSVLECHRASRDDGFDPCFCPEW